jgi:hypothetical protein
MNAVIEAEATYTLAQLKDLELDPNSEVERGAYETAIEKVLNWLGDDWDRCQFLTEDLTSYLEQESELEDAKVTQWDYDRSTLEFEGDINVHHFMESRKLRNKYRALYYAMDQIGCFDTYISFQTDKWRYKHDWLLEPWENDLDKYTDLYDDDRPRYDKILAQLKEVSKLIEDYISEWHSTLFKMMTAEVEYWYSSEYATEEAEVHELRFDASGNLIS